jgi:Ricin-type beta-trefoil lectin domain-like
MKMIKHFLDLLLLAISLGSSVDGYSQTIDTTKFYVITNMVLGEKQAMTGMVLATLGNAVMLRSAIDHPMQQWVIEQGKYGYRIYCREHGRGYSLEVVNEGSNSTKVSLGKTMEGSSDQTWRINIAKDGSYRLVSLWQNKAIDYVKTGERLNQLTLTEIESSIKSQTWRLVGIPKPKPAKPTVVYAPPVETGIPVMDTSAVYKLTCQFRGSGFAMEAVSDGNGGLKPMLRETKSNPAQQWKFKFYNSDGGFYRLVNSAYTDRSLDIVNDGKQNTNLTLATSGNYAGQYWRIVQNVDKSYWFISYWQRGQAIDVVNARNKDELIVSKSGRFTGQLWNFTKESPAVLVIETPPAIEESASNKNRLLPGEQLRENQKLISANGEHNLVQQADGNLVIYNSEQKAIWASGMNEKNVKRSVMQQNGSLTQHPGGYDLVIWSTQTDGNNGAYALLQDDGVLVIINRDNRIIWRSGRSAPLVKEAPVNDRLMPEQELAMDAKINSANGNFTLIFQQDGNLVVYDRNNNPLWATGTHGKKASRCVMQKDGNLVLYDIFKSPIWASNTHGHEGALLVLHDNGSLAVHSQEGSILWSNNVGEK